MTERLNKQQLKEDPLMKTTADAADFARHHSRLIVGAAAGLLVLAAAIYFVQAGGQRATERAAGMLADARGDYQKGALEPAAARLEELLSTSGGTAPGKQGAHPLRGRALRPGAVSGRGRLLPPGHRQVPGRPDSRNGRSASPRRDPREHEGVRRGGQDPRGAAGLRERPDRSALRPSLTSPETSSEPDRPIARRPSTKRSRSTRSSPLAAQEAQLRLAEIKAAQDARDSRLRPGPVRG